MESVVSGLMNQANGVIGNNIGRLRKQLGITQEL